MNNEFVDMYLKMFPGMRPTLFQMDMIEAEITDKTLWQETLRYWCGNDYRAQSVFKMIEYYKDLKQKDRGDTRTVGRYQPQEYIPPPPCEFCGSDVCLSSHDDERRQRIQEENRKAGHKWAQ